MLWHTQLATHTAHLVLEQPFQRLAQFQVHLFGQSTHIMMALDDHARDAETLNPVGINSTLRQPLGIGNLLGFLIEHINKAGTNNLALALGIGNAFQFLEELGGSIHAYDIQSQAFIITHHILELILAQQAMVHKNTSQILANSTAQQHGTNGRIHATAQTENHTVVTNLLFQLCHRSVHERCRAPCLVAATNTHHEILQQLGALHGMEHFGMELHAPDIFIIKLISCKLHFVSRSNLMTIFRQTGNGIAMAHPYL